MNLAVAAGGALGELDRFLAPLDPSGTDRTSWATAWVEAALHQEQLAEFDDANRFAVCAGRRSLRASVYHAISEWCTPPGPLRSERYSASLQAFANAREYARLPIERVEVSIPGAALPAIVCSPATPPARQRPVVVAIGGPDLTKEMVYCLIGDAFARAGIELFVVDAPGAGEALRLGGIPASAQSELSVGSAIDHLRARADLGRGGIGVLGIGLGGYDAVRTAALDPRINACAMWGGVGDVRATWSRRLASPEGRAFHLDLQLPWTMGTSDVSTALDRCDDWELTDLMSSFCQPLLVLHGNDDPVSDTGEVLALVDAARSMDKTVWLFDQDDGGQASWQVDQPAAALDILSSWFADRLAPVPA